MPQGWAPTGVQGGRQGDWGSDRAMFEVSSGCSGPDVDRVAESRSEGALAVRTAVAAVAPTLLTPVSLPSFCMRELCQGPLIFTFYKSGVLCFPCT